ncbi:Uma2 family endonuclease [Caloramator sp. ALD01]|uniref:Uma2 family endonuclease n=1 Tax=Caloramator sp. ALD01 TaxID=1031288 RepID=UPI000410124D|nr:Uma2 family endonuclease [Caloramator sp. ALD01]
MVLPERLEIYTYSDYKNKEDDNRYELINGRFYAMTPAPSRIHQKIITELSRSIGNYIEGNSLSCEVYVAPFDVRLIDDGQTEDSCTNVVQPDISVICDKTKLDDKGCIGAPEFIIEVVSPSNASVDYVKKLYLYEKFNVKEYWIINPNTEHIMIYTLGENNQYSEPFIFKFTEIISSKFLQGYEVKLSDIVKK